MKKTLLICLSVLMIALVGCKKETNSWGKLQESGVTVNVGDSVKLTFTSNGNQFPQWKTSDDFVAVVSGDGVVKGLHIGSCVVSVNDLECTVKVTDEYVDKLFDPWQESWYDVYVDASSVVTSYESQKRGNCVPAITYDTIPNVKIIVHRDTTWNPDGSVADINVWNDTVEDGTYQYVVTQMVFDYTASGVAERYVDKVIYNFTVALDEETNKYGSVLDDCALVTKTKATDLETFIDHRYEASNDIHYYAITSKLLCRISESQVGSETYFTYKADR